MDVILQAWNRGNMVVGEIGNLFSKNMSVSSKEEKKSFRACLGNILEEKSYLIFLDSEENPNFGEGRETERQFFKSSKPIKNQLFH